MNEYLQALEDFKNQLAAAAPARIVTRTFKDFALYALADRKKGIFTVLGAGIRSWPNGNSERVAEDGRHVIQVLGRIQLAEGVDGPTLEAAEHDLLDELLAVIRSNNLPESLLALYPGRLQQSQQLESPVGWIAMEIEHWALTDV